MLLFLEIKLYCGRSHALSCTFFDVSFVERGSMDQGRVCWFYWLPACLPCWGWSKLNGLGLLVSWPKRLPPLSRNSSAHTPFFLLVTNWERALLPAWCHLDLKLCCCLFPPSCFFVVQLAFHFYWNDLEDLWVDTKRVIVALSWMKEYK